MLPPSIAIPVGLIGLRRSTDRLVGAVTAYQAGVRAMLAGHASYRGY